MFNVSQFFKKLTEAKEKHDKAVKEAKLKTLYFKKRDQFSENYKKRVNQFIVEMSYEPIVVKQHAKPLSCFERIQEPKKFKGGHIMIMKGYRSEKERIKETLAQNSFLDNEGANFTKLNLRARDQSKEINPGMRFKAQSAIERVIDVVNQYQGIK